jgi:hypothetical protein
MGAFPQDLVKLGVACVLEVSGRQRLGRASDDT